MTPQEWQRLQELFEEAVPLNATERAHFLAGLDAPTREALRSLLESDDQGKSPIQEVIAGVAASSSAHRSDSHWIGRHIGPYLVTREIGRGGMGVVFEGRRDDPQFRQRVAIKIAIHASLSPALRERFRHERQMLAQLEHPNIGRLLDGGEIDGGLPFFAMEFVEGFSISRYCSENRLNVRQRIELYLQVCSAVDYAHQNLIVHRDIKPSNILVDKAGIPKLLDFGVAKLLDAALPLDGGATQTAFVPMTPDYCSPEQLRNQRITTRTDVYLLGLLLFELLTNQKAQVADTSSPLALEHSICEAESPMASMLAAKNGDPALARELRGDLDTIVAKACSKDPESRFATVADLAQELRRHLAGEPIESRPASFWYRSGKFARRNKLAIAGGAAVAAVLIGGIVSTTYQARRAARRFEQVRSIARTLTGEIHAAIQPLPGSVAAQELVVKTGLQYLDGLSKEAGSDPDLLIELAEGYTRIAAIQGADLDPSMGNKDEARRSLDRTEQILDRLLKENPDSERLLSIIVDSRITRAEIQNRSGQAEAAFKLLSSTEESITPLASKPGASLALIRRLGMARLTLARDFGTRLDSRATAKRLLESVALLESHAARDVEIAGEVAVGYSVAGGLYMRAGDVREAADCLAKAADRNRRILERDPLNRTSHRNLMLSFAKAADLYAAPGPARDVAKARDLYAKVAEEGEWLYRSDSSIKVNRVDYAMSSIRSADGFPPPDPRGKMLLTRGIKQLEEEIERDPKDEVMRRNLADARIRLGKLLVADQNWRAASSAFERAAREAEELIGQQPDNPVMRSIAIRAHMELGKLHSSKHDMPAVRSTIQHVNRLATPQFAARITAWKAELDRAR